MDDPRNATESLDEEKEAALNLSLLDAIEIPDSSILDSPSSDNNKARGGTDEPPVYTIDLSLPPRERYVALASDFKDELKGLTVLFGALIHDVHPKLPVAPFSTAARILLRKLYRKEENEEIKGISEAVGVDMWLLVTFNLLLDTFMGCSSGGIRVQDDDNPDSAHMMHYRTLDWGMDALRKVAVRLHFIQSPDPTVIAQTITYVGHVGVLTGVSRQGVSISLNFRAEHDTSCPKQNRRYLWHMLMVLLGRRPSIATVLRACLFSPLQQPLDRWMPHFRTTSSLMETIVQALERTRTCAAFLIVSDGDETAVMEKDLDSCETLRSRSFIAVTNSDAKHDKGGSEEMMGPKELVVEEGRGLDQKQLMEFMIGESVDRKRCMTEKWKDACERYKSEQPGVRDEDVRATQEDVIDWVSDFPVTNECTHFTCLMDARKGEIVWCARRLEAATPPAHMVAAEEEQEEEEAAVACICACACACTCAQARSGH